MLVIPYISANAISFGSTYEDVIAKLGGSFSEKRNRLNQRELVYEYSTYRFSDKENVLVEVTLNDEYFMIEGCCLDGAKVPELAFVNLGYVVAKLDPKSFVKNGFIVSPRYGIAFDPHYPSHVTAFASEELELWGA
jgi:hypothetical protein